MSPLTKLFVGLLVVLSLLLTAATVTFVNTLENQRELATRTKQTLENQKAEAESLDREGLAALKNFVESDDRRITDAAAQLAAVLRAEGKTAEADAVAPR